MAERLRERLDAPAGLVERGLEVGFGFDEGRGHDHHLVFDMVKRDDGIVETPDGVGQPEVVFAGGRQLFDEADRVVPHVTDGRSTREAWKTRDLDLLVLSEEVVQGVVDVAGGRRREPVTIA